MTDKYSSYKVLIAEDHDDTRFLLCEFARLKGVTVYQARDGYEAVELAKEVMPDLIFMDLSMPRMDGILATNYLRGADRLRNIPIVFITAHGELGIKLYEEVESIVRGGPIEYLPKPVSYSRMEEVFDQYLTG